MNSINQGKSYTRLMSGCKRHYKIKCINLTSENIKYSLSANNAVCMDKYVYNDNGAQKDHILCLKAIQYNHDLK